MNAKDPYRALDGVEPADQWDDIVERAERPSMEAPVPLAARRPLSQRPVLVAAAVLAVLAVAGLAMATIRGGDEPQQEVTAAQPESDPPTALWGRAWELVSITEGGEDRPVVPSMGGEPVRLDATAEGRVSAQGCNRLGAEVRLEGDRLKAVDGAFMTAAGCIGGDGEALMAQDELLQGLFAGGSEVAVRGDDLTLTSGDLVTRWNAVGDATTGPFWGRRWQVIELVRGGAPVELLPHRYDLGDGAKETQVLDTTLAPDGDEPGVIRVAGSCASARQGTAVVEDDGTLTSDPASWEPNGPVCAMADPTSEQTSAIVAVLTSAPAVSIDGNVLTLATDDGQHVLVAEVDETVGAPVSDGLADLWGVKWKVERLVENGVERPLAVADVAAPITLIGTTAGFPQRTTSGQLVDSEATGAISVATGCNGAGGPVHLEGDVLVADPGGFDDATGETFPGWVSTKRGCATDALDQDAFLMELLQSGPTVTIEGDRLTIAQGDDRLEAVRFAFEDLGNETETPATSEPAGPTTTVAPPSTTVPPTIPLPPPSSSVPVAGADAFFNRRWTVTAVSGDGASPAFEGALVDTRRSRVVVDGCNGAGGSVRMEGDQLVPEGEWVSTARGCAPTDGEDLMAQDKWFDAFLRARPTLDVRGMVATLTTATGQVELLMS